jgi:hypothetical protein
MRSLVTALTVALALLPVTIALSGRAQSPIEGATEIGDAPTLEPGAYSGSIPSGETQYFAFDLAEGQKAAVELLVGGSSSPLPIPVRLRLYNSRRVEDPFAGGPVFVEARERARLAARTGVAGHAPAYAAPGPHYVSVTAGGGRAARGPAFRFELRIDVERGAAAGRTAPPPDARADEPARLPIYILSFLGGVALGAGAVALRLKLREPAHGLRPGL